MRRIIIAAVIAFVMIGSGAWAQNAEFTAVNGKVEIQTPQGSWVAAEVGRSVGMDTVISTGFNATATLRVGNSTVEVAALTRMRFEEIASSGNTDTTALYLNVGRVSAEVRSTEGRQQDFRVRSPLSTAAVRGTSFTFDGERLTVREGAVAFVNALNQSRRVGGGQESTTTGTSVPQAPQEVRLQNVTVSTAPLGAAGGAGDSGPVVPLVATTQGPRSTTGGIRVRINQE